MGDKLELPHWVHTVGVEVGLTVGEHALKTVANRWAAARVASGLAKGAAGLIGRKAFGIPVVGPFIDLLTPSHTIMTGAHEKRLIQMERLRESRVQRPVVEQGIAYKSGVVY